MMQTSPIISIKSKLTSKNQVTVPKTVREILNIGPNEEISFVAVNGEVSIEKANQDIWEQEVAVEKKFGIVGKIDSDSMDWGADIGEEVID